MPQLQNELVNKALEMYKSGMKLIEIAKQLNIPPGTIRRWKSTYKWDSERSDNNSERSQRKKGGQPGNKNATGPPGNQNALKHGLFSRYLPAETMDIIEQSRQSNPLDLLWNSIQIHYASIIRAQNIMYVSNKDDLTKEIKSKSKGDSSEGQGHDCQESH